MAQMRRSKLIFIQIFIYNIGYFFHFLNEIWCVAQKNLLVTKTKPKKKPKKVFFEKFKQLKQPLQYFRIWFWRSLKALKNFHWLLFIERNPAVRSKSRWKVLYLSFTSKPVSECVWYIDFCTVTRKSFEVFFFPSFRFDLKAFYDKS